MDLLHVPRPPGLGPDMSILQAPLPPELGPRTYRCNYYMTASPRLP